MTCIHCNNTPGEIYIHHIEAICYNCELRLEKAPRKLKYLGITTIQDTDLVHHYQYLNPFYCPSCQAHLSQVLYYCKEDGMVVDFSQLQKVDERIDDKSVDIYRRFLVEEEYVRSFTDRGEVVPPFLVFQPFVIRDDIRGYMVPCKADYPAAELWNPDLEPFIPARDRDRWEEWKKEMGEMK